MLGRTLPGQAADAPTPDRSETDVASSAGHGPTLSVLAIGASAVAVSLIADQGAAGIFGGALALIMLAIAIIDARSFLIPNSLNAAAIMLGLANAAVLGQGDLAVIADAVLRALVVSGLFFALHVFYLRLRRRQGIGLGDVKLAAVAGIWLDWSMVPVAIEVAALSALATYGVRRYVLRQRLRRNARLPFGLFFAPAIWIGWLVQTAWPIGW